MLTVTLKPSRQLRQAVLSLHALAIASVWLADLSGIARWIASAGLLASAYWYGSGKVFGAGQLGRMAIDDEGTCSLWALDGVEYQGRVLGSSLVTPVLSVIRIRMSGRWLSRAIVIVPDAVSEDDYRRLRVHFRWKIRFS